MSVLIKKDPLKDLKVRKLNDTKKLLNRFLWTYIQNLHQSSTKAYHQ